jgi:hypothetical protein
VQEFTVPLEYLTKAYVEPQAVDAVISTDTIRVHPGAPIVGEDGKELIRFKDALGPMYYIQKTDKGFLFTLGMSVVYVKETDADLIQPKPLEANALLLSPKFKSAPFFDAKSGKEARTLYKGFAIQIEAQKDGKGFFTVSIDEKGTPVNKEFYIPIAYLTKGYVEPQAVIEIISLDTIVLRVGASVVGSDGSALAKFNEKLGPLHFIQKTDKGYQLLMGFNVVYVAEKDADLIPAK